MYNYFVFSFRNIKPSDLPHSHTNAIHTNIRGKKYDSADEKTPLLQHDRISATFTSSNQHQTTNVEKKKQPSLFSVLVKTFGTPILISHMLMLCFTILIFAGPVLQQ